MAVVSDSMTRARMVASVFEVTTCEVTELDSYLHIGRLLAVMQSRARRLLQNPDPDPSRRQ